MRLFFLPIILFLISCTTFHPSPKDQNDKHAIEYCGGELWGYVLPVGPREDKSFWTRKFEDPKTLMAIFMHMHSVLEKDPEHSLTLHFALRSREDLTIQFPKKVLNAQVEGFPEKEFKLEMVVHEDVLGVHDLYPDSKFKAELIDQKTNQWRIAKRNWFFTFITDEPKVVQLPTPKVFKISESSVKIHFDEKKLAQIFVLSSVNIWPAKEALKDAIVTVRLPAFIVNGINYASQTFTFNTNYEKVKQNRSSYGRCPSTEEVFRFNG